MRPAWLNKKISIKASLEVRQILRSLRIETVCEQAACPNIGECFSCRQVTFLMLGRYCSRRCSFCNIKKGLPQPPDLDEPGRVAEAVERLSLKHVIITSVTRDDLLDGGAGFFAQTVWRIRQKSNQACIELLIPDFKLSNAALEMVVEAGADIIGHNIETVPSLYPLARQDFDYRRSLDVLRIIKEINPCLKTKSALMLGMGEKEEEVVAVMQDLRFVGCDFLSIGQYLSPGARHYPVKEYIPPEQFDRYKQIAQGLGFLHIESSPYVRSSYLAGRYLK